MSLKPGQPADESNGENDKDPRRTRGRAYIREQPGGGGGTTDNNGVADDGRTAVSNGQDFLLCSPPKTENEVLRDSSFSGWIDRQLRLG